MKHQSDRTTVTRKAFDQKLQTILQTDRWIIDGNYQRTLPLRFEACTDVFFLDFPLKECLEGAASRVGMVRESGFSNAADTVWIEQSYLGEEALWEKAMAISAKSAGTDIRLIGE